MDVSLGGQGPDSEPFPPSSAELLSGRRLGFGPDVSVDERIAALAEGQHMCVSRSQLLAAGVSRSAIHRRLTSGRLLHLHLGVYGMPHTLELPLAAEAAALLACQPDAVLSHHTAATLWKLRAGTARPVHVTIRAGRGVPKLGGVQVHRSDVDPTDIRHHDGLPVTSPARTILDVAANLADRDIERMLAEAMFGLRILTRSEVERVLGQAGRHPGRARLTRVAGARQKPARTESPPEEALLRQIRAAGLPDPQLQTTVLDYRLDFYWPELLLAVEVDAYGTHGSPGRFEADRRRDARLLAERGILVIRFTAAAIGERPLETVCLLARTIGRREAELRLRS